MKLLVVASIVVGIVLVLFGTSLLATSSSRNIPATGTVARPNGDAEPGSADLTGLVPVGVGVGFILVGFISRVLHYKYFP